LGRNSWGKKPGGLGQTLTSRQNNTESLLPGVPKQKKRDVKGVKVEKGQGRQVLQGLGKGVLTSGSHGNWGVLRTGLKVRKKKTRGGGGSGGRGDLGGSGETGPKDQVQKRSS